MRRDIRRLRIAVAAALSAVLLVAVAAVAAPPPGKGHKPDNPGHGKPAAGPTPVTPTAAPTAGAAEYEYGAGGKQYGKHRVAICHKGHTIRVAQPAVRAHLRHGDKLGPC
jgi:hypothetical protein